MAGNFLRVCDLQEDELLALLARAQKLAEAFARREVPPLLRGKRIAVSFEDGGFRNRVAFELGIRLMGGEPVFVPGRPGEKEPAGDIARYLGNWFDAIVVRTPKLATIEEMAAAAQVPVINARTSHNHPCEILGDLAYIQKVRGSVKDLRIVFVGEATNLCHSWFEAGAVLPIAVTQVCPRKYEVDAAWLKALGAGKALRASDDLEAALREADVVYTDCWPGRRTSEERAAVEQAFGPYQITGARLGRTPAECLFLPCPPVTRGEEVSADAMTSDRCHVFAAKEFLLHAQNALLAACMGETRLRV